MCIATAALAAKPEAGCWGGCQPTGNGPVGGYFRVKRHKVEYFEISEACLGKSGVGNDNAFINYVPNMRVSKSGKFSFTGKAKRETANGTPSVHIVLKGTFVTSTKAKVSLKISYDHCGTKHATIVRQSG